MLEHARVVVAGLALRGDLEPVPRVDDRDREHELGELVGVERGRGLFPDVIGHAGAGDLRHHHAQLECRALPSGLGPVQHVFADVKADVATLTTQLAPNKAATADLKALSADLTKIPPSEYTKTKVLRTVVGGRTVYQSQ